MKFTGGLDGITQKVETLTISILASVELSTLSKEAATMTSSCAGPTTTAISHAISIRRLETFDGIMVTISNQH